MPRTRQQLEAAAVAAEDWLDSLDASETSAEDPVDLRRVGLALSDVAAAQGELADAVAAARATGRSWAMIGMVLGTSRQAAQKRYGRASDAA